jgi:two-component system KDP operon response regulator KdpE
MQRPPQMSAAAIPSSFSSIRPGVKCREATSATILVVEDDPVLCEVLCRIFSRDGYAVGQALNASQALELVAQRSPQLVLLDVGLREGTGFQLAETLRAHPSGLQVVLLSNHRLESSVLRGWSARKLTKSVDLPDLRAAVSAALADVRPQHSPESGP